MRLEAGGIPAYIQDENFVQIDQLLANAVGGVRVQVVDEDMETARTLLTEDRGEPNHQPAYRCPNCHSTHVVREPFSRPVAFLTILFLGFPLLWLKPSLRCEECLHTWKPGKQA